MNLIESKPAARPARAAAALLAVVLFACTSPTAPLPTGPNATVTGTVVERVDGAPYSFLRLATDSGQLWVAVPIADVPRRSRVTVKNGATVKDFDSRQAGRKFEAVVFGVLDDG